MFLAFIALITMLIILTFVLGLALIAIILLED